MNKQFSLGIKVAAIILSVLTLAVTVGSVFGTVIIADSGLFTNSLAAVQKDEVYNILQNRCLNAAYRYAQGGTDEVRQFFEYQNTYLRITDTDGNVLIDTYEEIFGEQQPEPWLTYTEDYAIVYNPSWSHEEYIIYEREYTPSDPNTVLVDTVSVTGYIPAQMHHMDEISLILYWLRVGYNWRYLLPILGFLALLTSIILYIFLLCSAGHHPGMKEAVPNVFDKIPLDLHAAALVLLAVFAAEVYPYYDTEWAIICAVLYPVLGYLLLLQFTMSFATRVKIGTVLKGTLIWKIGVLLWRILRAIGRAILTLIANLPILAGTVLLLAVGIVWSFLSMVCLANGEDFGIILWIVGWAVIVAGAIYLTLCMQKL